MKSTPIYVTVTTAVVSGVIVFVLGQIFQQYILEPLREFRRQRADAIYFVLHFIDLVNGDVAWDQEDKKEVKKMHAALIQSMVMVPCFEFLSRLKVLRLPNGKGVRAAAKKMAHLAQWANSGPRKGEPAALQLANEIAVLLRIDLSK